jgi:hypothetical protein
MSHRRFHRHKEKKMTEFEKFQWALFIGIFVVSFVCIFAYRFVTNCVFEWPIRWDVKVCWNEQVGPAKDAAAEKAANFAP